MAYRKLGRNSDHRIALLKNMVTSLLVNGEIVTTEAKAKEIKRLADKVITLSKVDINNPSVDGKEVPSRVNARREASRLLTGCVSEQFIKTVTGKEKLTPKVRASVDKQDVINKLFTEIAEKYKERNGGYTAVYKMGPRKGDAAPMAVVKLV